MDTSHELFADYMKHVTTLSTGSILLTVTFLEKLFAQPEAKWLVVLCYISLILSILCALISMMYNFASARRKVEGNLPERTEFLRIRAGLMFAALLSFAVGVIFLAAFAVVNLY